MSDKRKSLFMQDEPGIPPNPQNSHPFNSKWRKIFFQLAFKALEVLLVILQIIQCICEMFKR